jgi:hypothetical protein
MAKPGIDLREIVDALAAVHPWIRLVVRGHYAPSLATAGTAARELVSDIDLARAEESSHRLTRVFERIADIADALEPDDTVATLDQVLEPAMDIARELNLDRAAVFFPVSEIIPVMDRAITTVTMFAVDLMAAVDSVLEGDGDVGSGLGLAVDRARELDRALSGVLYVLNDFTATDLRDVELAELPLGGVLWSDTTRWPPDVLRRVVRDSVKVRAGVFAIRETAPDAVPADAGRRGAWTVTRDEARHMAQLWATAGQSPAYPLIGSVVAEFDLGYVLTEQLPPEYAPLSTPRWAVVDRVTGDLRMWQSEMWKPLSADAVVERFRTWHAQQPPSARTWDVATRVPAATPSHVTYLRLPDLHPKVPDRWIRACGVQGGHAAPAHHPLVRQVLESMPPGHRPGHCSEAAATSDALHTEDAARAAAGQPPVTLEQARNRLFVNAGMLTYRLNGGGGPAKGERVPPCASCELLIRHFSYQDNPAATAEELRGDLRLLVGWEGQADGADLDTAIAAFRRIRQGGPTQQIRDLGTEKLFASLVRRFRDEGNVADLDEVIELHEIDKHRITQQQTVSAPRLQAAGEKWVEEAYRQRAKITGSSVDHTIAAALRWYSPRAGSAEPAFDIDKVHMPDGYAIRAANERSRSHPNRKLAAEVEKEIARLRAEPGLERRLDLLDRLVDALAALEIATGSAQVLDELIETTELLISAIPDHDAHHRAAHRFGLGSALYHRRKDAGGGPEDARDAFVHLEHAAAAEVLETHARIRAAQVAGEAAWSAGDLPSAARMYRLAVDLLPRLVPRHLSPADHARLLAPMAGLVSEAATGVLRAGDPGGALELLEQGRGLLIGHALDARDGTTEELRRIADELATSLDPHADREPGQPSAVDRRRELGRAWEGEVSRIRTLAGFEDYLLPRRLADLSPLAASGPVVTIVVSGRDANALLLTSEGVDVVALPGLTGQGLDEMVETFLGTLPFAELMPGDEDATVQAQEPLRGVLARLWDTLAAPVLERLGPRERIWWVPTGMVAALPLHAAGRGEDSVLDRVVSSYTPTIKVLQASRSRASRGSDTTCVVAVADAPGLPALPHTRTEAFEVMRRFDGTTRLDGPAATPDAVLGAVTRSGWLHLACHATSNVTDPASCALHVHGGQVTAREVMSRRAPSGRLAYLSSCRTVMANGAEVVDEMIHLGSAFQIAGFRHVVGTLWRVGDSMAAATAKLFYQQVGAAEDNAPQALHHTVKQLRERYPLMPARWAPYVHLGG